METIYSHSTITFIYEGKQYKLNFKKVMSNLPFQFKFREAGIDMSDMKKLDARQELLLSLWKSVEN